MRNAISSAEQTVSLLRSLKTQERSVRVEFAAFGSSFLMESLLTEVDRLFVEARGIAEPAPVLKVQLVGADKFSGEHDDNWCLLVIERFAGHSVPEYKLVIESGWDTIERVLDRPN